MQVKQQDVLEAVARPVIQELGVSCRCIKLHCGVQDVLNGVNGTIFAYGQTGRSENILTAFKLIQAYSVH